MLNFEFYNPTNYVFGKDQITKLDSLLPSNSTILLLYGGGSIFKNGIYDSVIAKVGKREIIEFGGVEANPTYETLMKAVALIREKNIGFILAVGGGSVIDGAKFVSAAVHYEGDAVDILKQRILFKDKSVVVPFGTVLTLPATGSEMNSGSVITINATKEKLTLGGSALFPVFSICDPSVVFSLPLRQIQNGIVDAYMHVLEQYLTNYQSAFLQDRIAEGILQTLIHIGPKIIENPKDYNLAANFMWCCTMALNGLIQKGVPSDWATHMIGHELTALYEIDHARTLAIIAPRLYSFTIEEKKQKLKQYASRVWGIESGSDDDIAKAAIEKTEQFFKHLGVQTKLSEYVSDYEKTADFIKERFSTRGWVGLGENKSITPEKVHQIVTASYV